MYAVWFWSIMMSCCGLGEIKVTFSQKRFMISFLIALHYSEVTFFIYLKVIKFWNKLGNNILPIDTYNNKVSNILDALYDNDFIYI